MRKLGRSTAASTVAWARSSPAVASQSPESAAGLPLLKQRRIDCAGDIEPMRRRLLHQLGKHAALGSSPYHRDSNDHPQERDRAQSHLKRCLGAFRCTRLMQALQRTTLHNASHNIAPPRRHPLTPP